MKGIILMTIASVIATIPVKAQQELRVSVENEKVVVKAFNNNVAVDAKTLDTKKEILITPTDRSILGAVWVRTQPGGTLLPVRLKSDKKGYMIPGRSRIPKIRVAVKVRKIKDAASIDVGNVEENKEEKAAEDETALVSCGCENNGYQEDITEALTDCPDCGDSKYLVYDARCKALYIQGNGGNWNRVTDMKKIRFRFKEEFKIKVIHINKYLNDIVISADEMVYESTPPAIFNYLFSGSGDLATALIQRAKQSLTEIPSDKIDFHQAFKEDVVELLKILDEFSEQQDKIYTVCCEPTALCNDKTLDANIARIKELSVSIPLAYSVISPGLNAKVAEREELEKKVKDLQAKIDGATDKTTKEDMKKWENEIATAQKGIEKLAGISEEKLLVDALLNLFNKTTDAQKRVLVLFNRNLLRRNFVYTTPPIYPQGNRMTIKLEVNPKETSYVKVNGIFPTERQELEIVAPVTNKWFVSFSAGPFAAFNKNLYATRYEFVRQANGNPIGANSKYKLLVTGETDPPIGVTGLGHLQTQFSENWGGGFSVGAGLTAESKPRLGYLLGGTLFVGSDKHQFGFTLGLAGMQANELNKDLYPDNVDYDAPIDLSFRRDFRVGGFVSLTYTLFSPSPRANTTNKNPVK
ncbi:MAG: hypothetical protein EOO16_07005 [Chitinophagaceae bacterium]|nr:MAG: hypothetical protein EOO16_07005 [Chitinophagaceae bacterium]